MIIPKTHSKKAVSQTEDCILAFKILDIYFLPAARVNSQVGLKLIEFLCKYTHVKDEFGIWPAEAAFLFFFF